MLNYLPEFLMKWLNCQETINKLHEKGLTVCHCSTYKQLVESPSGIKENLNAIHELRVMKDMFVINKHNADAFFNTLAGYINDPDFNKIVKILKIYAYLDYLLYTVNNNGFSINTRDLEATYVKRTPVKKTDTTNIPTVRHSNLCLEISLGPTMECTLQAKNTEYHFIDLYNKVIYPAFKAMLKETIDLDIKNINEFNDDMFDLLKMAKI